MIYLIDKQSRPATEDTPHPCGNPKHWVVRIHHQNKDKP